MKRSSNDTDVIVPQVYTGPICVHLLFQILKNNMEVFLLRVHAHEGIYRQMKSFATLILFFHMQVGNKL
jgi:hypothetical protein